MQPYPVNQAYKFNLQYLGDGMPVDDARVVKVCIHWVPLFW